LANYYNQKRFFSNEAFGDWVLPGPTQAAYNAPPDPLAGFKGVTLQAERTGKGRDKGGERDAGSSTYHQFLDPPLLPTIEGWHAI